MQTLKETLRDSILAKARKEFSAHGYDNAAMKTIAHGCGVSVGTVYKYFGGKKALFMAAAHPAQEVFATLGRCADAGKFYDKVMAHRVRLRILLFRNDGFAMANAPARHRQDALSARMLDVWLKSLLEVLLMHKPTKTVALQLIKEYINVVQLFDYERIEK